MLTHQALYLKAPATHPFIQSSGVQNSVISFINLGSMVVSVTVSVCCVVCVSFSVPGKDIAAVIS